MNNDDESKKIRQKILEGLVETNDTCIIVLGNYLNSDAVEMELEFAVNAQEQELFEMFLELFQNESVKSEARKAILYSDYGKSDDSLDNLLN
ncbi:hypothetical protein [uncultured Mediterranean phage uvMED]|nr:hypothetical protein [uncultured Mediterranean phage uvMED]